MRANPRQRRASFGRDGAQGWIRCSGMSKAAHPPPREKGTGTALSCWAQGPVPGWCRRVDWQESVVRCRGHPKPHCPCGGRYASGAEVFRARSGPYRVVPAWTCVGRSAAHVLPSFALSWNMPVLQWCGAYRVASGKLEVRQSRVALRRGGGYRGGTANGVGGCARARGECLEYGGKRIAARRQALI